MHWRRCVQAPAVRQGAASLPPDTQLASATRRRNGTFDPAVLDDVVTVDANCGAFIDHAAQSMPDVMKIQHVEILDRTVFGIGPTRHSGPGMMLSGHLLAVGAHAVG